MWDFLRKYEPIKTLIRLKFLLHLSRLSSLIGSNHVQLAIQELAQFQI